MKKLLATIFLVISFGNVTNCQTVNKSQFFYTMYYQGEGTFQLFMLEFNSDSLILVSGKWGFTYDKTLDPDIKMDTVNKYILDYDYMTDEISNHTYQRSSKFAHRYIHQGLGGKAGLDIYKVLSYKQSENNIDFIIYTSDEFAYRFWGTIESDHLDLIIADYDLETNKDQLEYYIKMYRQ